MGIDAILLLRPRSRALLRGVLDPDTHRVRILEDGALLLSSFARFAPVKADLEEGRAILASYGPGLVSAHDDARGILMFPDILEPRGRTYDAVVAEVESSAIWVPSAPLDGAELEVREAMLLAELDQMMALSEAMQQHRSEDDEGADRTTHDFSPSPSTPSMEQLMAQLGAALSATGARDDFEAVMAAGATCFLMKNRGGSATLGNGGGSGFFGIQEVRVLDDGTLVVMTDRGGPEATDMVALGLGHDAGAWKREHTDPRGVPTFPEAQLPLIASAATYDDALTRLGQHVAFVTPFTIDEQLEQERAAFRKYLQSDD